MSRIAYVNGLYMPTRSAVVQIDDRGYQFADGVYEVCVVRDGRIIDEERHLKRLERSLGELSIRWPVTPSALAIVMREVIQRNRVRDGTVYIQVTRGVGPRNHVFTPETVCPSLVVTARSVDWAVADESAAKGIAVISTPDNRWERVDIKTISLLPNVLAKQKAKEAGAGEAWFVDSKGFVTEGASSNAWIVTMDGVLVTRDVDRGILRGVTRDVVLKMLERENLVFEERRFTIAEAQSAREAFITSAGNLVMPVIKIDGRIVGSGMPGELSLKLRQLFFTEAEASPRIWRPKPIAHNSKLFDK